MVVGEAVSGMFLVEAPTADEAAGGGAAVIQRRWARARAGRPARRQDVRGGGGRRVRPLGGRVSGSMPARATKQLLPSGGPWGWAATPCSPVVWSFYNYAMRMVGRRGERGSNGTRPRRRPMSLSVGSRPMRRRRPSPARTRGCQTTRTTRLARSVSSSWD